VAHPSRYQGYGQPRDRHAKPSVPAFVSERMETNKEPGRFLIETTLSPRPGAVPTAVRQTNSKQAPQPASDRMMQEMGEG
jgi:hypothetical protein